MTLTDRDRKIVIVLVPLLVVLGFWFLALAPKRSQASKVQAQLAKAERRRDTAVAKAGSVESARTNYAKDYEVVVRLGKAIPSNVDMPSLIVQLSKASKGTHIDFRKVKTGDRSGVPAASSTPSAGASSSGGSGGAAAAGGQSAQTGAGKAAESANNAKSSAESNSSSSGGSSSGKPAGSTAAGSNTGTTPAGLDTAPLEFGFDGSFFDLTDFFHRMKRFVRVANKDLKVGGRLMTIDSFSFDGTSFPAIKAEIKATVYLSPRTEGATAGATSEGPASSTPASGSTPTPPPTPGPTSGSGPSGSSGAPR